MQLFNLDHNNKRKLFFGISLFVLAAVVITIIVVVQTKSGTNPLFSYVQGKCPSDFDPLPLILVSLDGFRPTYLNRGVTPTLNSIVENGVSAPYMVPVYPSKTFPNHYSIITGLYAESHGIIDNKFYDSDFNATFSYKTDEVRLGRWWGGEPLWNTIKKIGLKSATYFWVGSEALINGMQPDYWFKYDSKVPFQDRVEQVLEWLQKPASSRPSFISLYTHEPDSTGHRHGPESEEVASKLKEVDEMMNQLLKGIKNLNLLGCVNIIVVSDHGMTFTDEKLAIQLQDIFDKNVMDRINFNRGAAPKIRIKDEYKNDPTIRNEIEKSACGQSYTLFRVKDVPKRLHFSHNSRIGDYIFLQKNGRSVIYNSSDYILKGTHGYDTVNPNMNTIFMAIGPSFKKKYNAKPFKNVELYNLMSYLMRAEPAPNNGSGTLIYSLLNAPPDDKNTEGTKLPDPAISQNQGESNFRSYLCGNKSDENLQISQQILAMNKEQKSEIEKNAAPFGTPLLKKEADATQFTMLFYPDYISGYSKTRKTTLWTSRTFNIQSFKVNDKNDRNLTWIPDFRLTPNEVPSCRVFESTKHSDYNFVSLLTDGSNPIIKNLVSNAVLVNEKILPVIKYTLESFLNELLKKSKSDVNVVAGVLFDPSPNSHDDKFINGNFEIPTDIFVIISRCSSSVLNLDDCERQNIETMSFILPQNLTNVRCFDTSEDILRMYHSTIQDIEYYTDFKFFPKFSMSERLEIISKQFDGKLW